MKKAKYDPFMKLRIVISTTALLIIIGGWLIFGVRASYSHPNRVLIKLAINQKKEFADLMKKTDLNNYVNTKVSFNKDSIYINRDKEKLYLINNNSYYDISKYLSKYGIKVNNNMFNSDNYEIIMNSFIDSITHNYKLFDSKLLKDTGKEYFVYSFTLSNMKPIVLSLGGDKSFMTSITKTLGCKQEDAKKILDLFNDRALGINIVTKGKRRKISYYTINIDGILNITFKESFINGYILNNSFSISDKFVIYTENDYYDINFKKGKISIKGKEEISISELMSFYK